MEQYSSKTNCWHYYANLLATTAEKSLSDVITQRGTYKFTATPAFITWIK